MFLILYLPIFTCLTTIVHPILLFNINAPTLVLATHLPSCCQNHNHPWKRFLPLFRNPVQVYYIMSEILVWHHIIVLLTTKVTNEHTNSRKKIKYFSKNVRKEIQIFFQTLKKVRFFKHFGKACEKHLKYLYLGVLVRFLFLRKMSPILASRGQALWICRRKCALRTGAKLAKQANRAK